MIRITVHIKTLCGYRLHTMNQLRDKGADHEKNRDPDQLPDDALLRSVGQDKCGAQKQVDRQQVLYPAEKPEEETADHISEGTADTEITAQHKNSHCQIDKEVDLPLTLRTECLLVIIIDDPAGPGLRLRISTPAPALPCSGAFSFIRIRRIRRILCIRGFWCSHAFSFYRRNGAAENCSES